MTSDRFSSGKSNPKENLRNKCKVPDESKIISGIMNVIELVEKAKLVKYSVQTEDGWKMEVWKLDNTR